MTNSDVVLEILYCFAMGFGIAAIVFGLGAVFYNVLFVVPWTMKILIGSYALVGLITSWIIQRKIRNE